MIQPRLPPIIGMLHPFKTNRLCNIPSLIYSECIALELKSSKSSLSVMKLCCRKDHLNATQKTLIKATKPLDLLLIPQHFFIVISHLSVIIYSKR